MIRVQPTIKHLGMRPKGPRLNINIGQRNYNEWGELKKTHSCSLNPNPSLGFSASTETTRFSCFVAARIQYDR